MRPTTPPLTTLSAGRVRGDGVDRYKLRPALDRKTVGRVDRFVCGIGARAEGPIQPRLPFHRDRNYCLGERLLEVNSSMRPG